MLWKNRRMFDVVCDGVLLLKERSSKVKSRMRIAL